MGNGKTANRRAVKTGKLAVSPTKRQEFVERGLLAQGGTVRGAAAGEAPPRDQAAFVRALLGR